MLSNITCSSSRASTCYNNIFLTAASGYYCKDSNCYQCPPGTFGTDGKFCNPCPFGSWTPLSGQPNCQLSFTYSIPIVQKVYIPYGVTKISVNLLDIDGVGSDNTLHTSDFSRQKDNKESSSCNMTVPMSQEVCITIGSEENYMNSIGTAKGEFCMRSCSNISGISTPSVPVMCYVCPKSYVNVWS